MSELQPQAEAALLPVTLDSPDGPLVGVLMSSTSYAETMAEAERILREAEVPYETAVLSPHRDPDGLAEWCRGARGRGLKVIIAGAGLGAALPGIAAAHTDLPVIGVPLSGSRSIAGGLDALLGVAQMPAGVPVACVGVDSPSNAAHLAVRILGA